MEEKEKQKDVCTIRRGGDLRVVRKSLMWVAGDAP